MKGSVTDIISSVFKLKLSTLLLLIPVLVAGLLVSDTGCRKNRIKRGPANVLLVTVDTLRADHVGVYGYPYIRTPVMDGLAAEGIMFEHALASVPLTLPSHSSIMTGLYPPAHGVRDNNSFVLPDEITTIAEILREKGYRTGAVVAAFILDQAFGLKQGFDTYDDSGMSRDDGKTMVPERQADVITNHALAWLRYQAGKEPFFLWVHYYDPHASYTPPSPFAEEYPASRYDGEIAFVDQQLGRLIEGARKTAEDMPLAIIFTSDHGESLGEHREMTHGLFIYHSSIHVPLIISAPGLAPENIRIKSQVPNAAIAPTILDLLGMPIPAYMQTQSLFTLVENKDKDDKSQVYIESQNALINYNWSDLRAISAHGYYYIQAPRPELYDIENDFSQKNNLFQTEPDTARRMKRLLELKEKEISSETFQKKAKNNNMSSEVTANLEALGYISITDTDNSTGETVLKDLPDPKDNIEFHMNIMKANILKGEKKYEEALIVLERVLKEDPDNPRLLLHYGKAMQNAGRIEEAREYMIKALKKKNNYGNAVETLARLEFEEGNLKEAKKLYEMATELMPQNVVNLRQLAKIAIKEGDKKKAEKYLWEVVNVTLKDLNAIELLQELLTEQGKNEEIRQLLEKAHHRSPTDTIIMKRLAKIRADLKDRDGALNMFEKIVELDPRDATTHFNLALALRRGVDNKPYGPGADIKGALTHFNLALEFNPQFPKAEDAGKMIKEIEAILRARGQLPGGN